MSDESYRFLFAMGGCCVLSHSAYLDFLNIVGRHEADISTFVHDLPPVSLPCRGLVEKEQLALLEAGSLIGFHEIYALEH
jgi:hypothetical protein